MVSVVIKLRKIKVQIFLPVLAVLCLLFVAFTVGTKAENKDKINILNNQTIVNYIESFGWVVEPEPLEKELITVPFEFNEIYNNYNSLQQKQGFDLAKHKGEQVYRFTYKVINYNNNENIRINLLIKTNGKIIGGDICSVELNGFMEGFK